MLEYIFFSQGSKVPSRKHIAAEVSTFSIEKKQIFVIVSRISEAKIPGLFHSKLILSWENKICQVTWYVWNRPHCTWISCLLSFSKKAPFSCILRDSAPFIQMNGSNLYSEQIATLPGEGLLCIRSPCVLTPHRLWLSNNRVFPFLHSANCCSSLCKWSLYGSFSFCTYKLVFWELLLRSMSNGIWPNFCTVKLQVCFPMIALYEIALYWMAIPHVEMELLFLNSHNYAEFLQYALEIEKGRIFQRVWYWLMTAISKLHLLYGYHRM